MAAKKCPGFIIEFGFQVCQGMWVYYHRRTSGNKSTVGTFIKSNFYTGTVLELLLFSPSQTRDFFSYEYLIFIQIQSGDRRKVPPGQKMVTQYFHHFCMMWPLFSEILSTSVKYVDS